MFAIVASSQFYCLWLAIIAVTAYDFLYIACCVHIIIQLRLLKWKIRDTLDKYQVNPKEELCYYIKHHQFLYSMFRDMRKIFSVMLLFHYLVTLIASCFVLLQLFLRNMDAISYASQILTIVFFIAQFALYTFPAEEVAFEFLDVPNSIHLSKWYKHKVEIQKLILYVIMKSQQQKYFTGAGLIDINVETFDSEMKEKKVLEKQDKILKRKIKKEETEIKKKLLKEEGENKKQEKAKIKQVEIKLKQEKIALKEERENKKQEKAKIKQEEIKLKQEKIARDVLKKPKLNKKK
ncbi:7tm Odorant receptor [Popillia japonica]|uniref:7tm Odorant receptor n=1 Tax=Popillia japonica TaxID=7064 RepID=A0AAW1IB80_POPJA